MKQKVPFNLLLRRYTLIYVTNKPYFRNKNNFTMDIGKLKLRIFQTVLLISIIMTLCFHINLIKWAFPSPYTDNVNILCDSCN